MSLRLPTIDDIRAAHDRLRPHIVATPLLEHPTLNERAGGRVLLKCENLQRLGAFKFRGAHNKISQVDRAAYPGGVVACSSGSHAQGGEVIPCDRVKEDREAIAARLCEARGAAMVHPFDDWQVMAGQGTVISGGNIDPDMLCGILGAA